jgi:hypothetical protein
MYASNRKKKQIRVLQQNKQEQGKREKRESIATKQARARKRRTRGK